MIRRFRCLSAIVLVLCACGRPPLANRPSPLRIESRRFERVVPGCGDLDRREQPCFSFQAVYPEVVAAPDEDVKRRLNASILALLQPAGAEAGFDAEASRLLDKYAARPPAAAEDEEPAWFVRRSADVVHSSAAALAVRAERTEYVGGAASSSVLECVNLVPSTGAVLSLTDLFDRDAAAKLRLLAEARFRADRGIPAARNLSAVGFFFPADRFALPRCFLVAANGLEFVFTPEETGGGPGWTHLLLRWADLRPLVRRQSGVVPD